MKQLISLPSIRPAVSAFVIATVATAGSQLAAQQTTAAHQTASKAMAGSPSKSVGLLIVAHGADSAWNSRVRETVAQTKWSGGPVRVAFLMGPEAETSGWDKAVTGMRHDGIGSLVVVPLMVSTYGGHFRQIQYYAGEISEMPSDMMVMGHSMKPPVRPGVPVRVAPALDDSPELGQALGARWHELSAADRKRPLMLIAHGPNDQEDVAHWESNIMTTAKRLRAEVAPQPVRLALLRDDAPASVRAASVAAMRDTIQSLARAAHDSVTVMPVLISTGAINDIKIPADIKDLPVRYAGLGLAPQPVLAKWIARIADSVSTAMQNSQHKAASTPQFNR